MMATAVPDGLFYSNDNYVNQQKVAPWTPDNIAESYSTCNFSIRIAVDVKKVSSGSAMKYCCGLLRNDVVVEEN